MSDLWADRRERIKTNLEGIQIGFNQGDSSILYSSLDEISKDADDILADADALLAANRKPQEGYPLPRWVNIVTTYQKEIAQAQTLEAKGSLKGFGEAMLSMYELLYDIAEAHANLPEHLR